MSINTYEINDNQKGYGQNYNQLADMYRQRIQKHQYKYAKEVEVEMHRKDVEMAKDGLEQ